MTRKLLYLPLGLLAAIVIASLVLPVFIDPASFKGPLVGQLQQSSGYNVRIDGAISIRLLPSARVRVENVSVSSPQRGEKPFARVGVLDVGVRLLPLVRGKIEVTKLFLKEPVLNLVKDKNGTNWQPRKLWQDTREDQKTGQPDKGGNVPGGIVMNAVEIDKGTVTYKDTVKGQAVTLTALDLDAGMSSPGKSFSLRAHANWNEKPIAFKLDVGSLAALLGNGKVPLQMAFNSEKLKFDLQGAVEEGRFAGVINASSRSLLEAMGWLAGEKPKGAVQVLAFDLHGKLGCSRVQCVMDESKLKLGESDLRGALKANIADDKPLFVLDLQTALLDLTPYMATKTAGLSLIRSAHAASPRWSETPFDLSALQAANATVTLKADNFQARQFTAGKTSLSLRVVDGDAVLDSSSDALYGGTGKFTASMNADGHAEYNLQLSSVDIEPFLKASADSDRFSGKANAEFALSSQGKSERAIVSSLSGSGSFKITDGSINGVDIAGMVRNVKSAFIETDTSGRKTDFAELSATFTASNGIIGNSDLSMKAPLFRVGGKGTVNLPDWSIDYRLNPQMVDTLKGQGSTRTGGLGVPILVKGSLDGPAFVPDIASTVEEAIKDPKKFKENVKENKAAIKDILKEGQSLLKGFKR